DKITPYDIESGRELGYVVKLLAIGKKCGNKIEVRVHPAFVPAEHMLAGVRGSFNAIHLTGDNVGEMMMYGRGAGDLPTGSAIVSDIVYCSSLNKPQYAAFENNGALAADIVNVADWESRYYFMIACKDAPGVLAKVTSILGGNNVSIDTVIQRGRKNNKAFVLFLTHMTSEKAVQQAISEIRLLNVVDEVVSLIRVID
ncbi:MAG: ACT domain-containing protein, partial [Clostridiales bacterium]|nr:ACT domain-containing protein [Clostridiales bacterium]